MSDDYMQSLSDTTDRLRLAEEEIHNQPPKTVKRPSQSPSGQSQRSVKTRNAYARIQSKKGRV